MPTDALRKELQQRQDELGERLFYIAQESRWLTDAWSGDQHELAQQQALLNIMSSALLSELNKIKQRLAELPD